MTTTEVDAVENPGNSEETRVVDWRKKELVKVGYYEIHAKRIAERHQGPDAIDLHQAIELVTVKGAPPHLAADILL